ncbi:MAG: hypothetical protein PHF35_03165 [Candidatus Moranbacteria bacterium]|nr:hypothetical protein [Candidatus Moranbacteria bacterium]
MTQEIFAEMKKSGYRFAEASELFDLGKIYPDVLLNKSILALAFPDGVDTTDQDAKLWPAQWEIRTAVELRFMKCAFLGPAITGSLPLYRKRFTRILNVLDTTQK